MDLRKINLARCETSAVLASTFLLEMIFLRGAFIITVRCYFSGPRDFLDVSEAKMLGKLFRSFFGAFIR